MNWDLISPITADNNPWAQGMGTGMCHPGLAVAQGAGGSWSFPKLGNSLEGKGFPAGLDSSVSFQCLQELSPPPWCSNTTSPLPGLPQTHRIHKILCFINQQLQLLSSLCHKVWRKETKKSSSEGEIPRATSCSQHPNPGQELLAAASSWDTQGLREQPGIPQAALWD